MRQDKCLRTIILFLIMNVSMNPLKLLLKSLAFAIAFTTLLQGKPLELWISSFQDQVYYEKIADLFAKKNKGFELKVKVLPIIIESRTKIASPTI